MVQAKKPDERAVRGVFHVPDDHRIYYANVTRFSHLGTDVILDIGVMDEQQIIAANQKPEETDVQIDVYIQHRIAFGLAGFIKLKENIDDIIKKLVATGTIEATEESETPASGEKPE